MEDPNKIDLKDVNKNKKSFKLPKPNSLFKKQSGQERDELGKFATTTGSGGLLKAKNFNLKRALPVIIVVALLGGIFVFKSFAASAQENVANMYRSCLNREPDPGGLAYWSGRLANGEQLGSVLLAFMKAAGVSSCPYPSTPRTGSTPAPTLPSSGGTGSSSSNPLNDAKAWVTLADAHVANAQKENAITYAISIKSVVSKEDLATIASKDGYIRGAIKQLQDGVGKVSSLYNQAVSNPSTRSQGPEILNQLTLLQSDIASLNIYLTNVSNDYKRAEATYQANLGFFGQLTNWARQKADCLEKSGTWNDWTHKCTLPPPVSTVSGTACAGVRASSSRSDIQACQQLLGITADGCWGTVTANAFHARFPSASGWQTLGQCAGGGGGTVGGTTGSSQSRSCPKDTNEWINVDHGKKQVSVVFTLNSGKCQYARSVSWSCNRGYGHPTGVNDCYIKSYTKPSKDVCRKYYSEFSLGYSVSCTLNDDGGRIYTSTGIV